MPAINAAECHPHALQDPKKFARGMQLLQMNEEIKTAKKVSNRHLMDPGLTHAHTRHVTKDFASF